MIENDLLLALMDENRKLDHDAEQRQIAIAHLSIIVTLVSLVVISLLGFHHDTLPMTILMILMGLYGLLATMKLYERSQYHIVRARKLRAQLSELLPDAHVEDVLEAAEYEHRDRYPRLMKMRLNHIWLGIHGVVVIFGIVYSILCIL